MSEHLPREVWEGLSTRRARKGLGASRIESNGRSVSIRRSWEGGFAIASEEACGIRGSVDFFDGPRHLGRCLIYAIETREDETLFGIKRCSFPQERAPVDFPLAAR